MTNIWCIIYDMIYISIIWRPSFRQIHWTLALTMGSPSPPQIGRLRFVWSFLFDCLFVLFILLFVENKNWILWTFDGQCLKNWDQIKCPTMQWKTKRNSDQIKCPTNERQKEPNILLSQPVLPSGSPPATRLIQPVKQLKLIFISQPSRLALDLFYHPHLDTWSLDHKFQ